MKRPTQSKYIHAHKPSSAADILERTLGAYHLSQKAEQYAVFPRWPEAVGEEIAKVATPEKIIRSRVLVVRVSDATWAQELSLRKIELLKAVNSYGVGSIIEDIKFVTGSPKRGNKTGNTTE